MSASSRTVKALLSPGAIRVPWILMMSNEERLCLGIDEFPRKLLHLFELDALR